MCSSTAVDANRGTIMFNSHRSAIRAFVMSALPVAFFALPSQASTSAGEPRSLTVHFSDLNLDNPTAVAALYGRIHAAAAAVCTLPESGDRWARIEQDKCVSHSLATAVRGVRNARLSAYHWQQIRGWKHRSGEIILAESAH